MSSSSGSTLTSPIEITDDTNNSNNNNNNNNNNNYSNNNNDNNDSSDETSLLHSKDMLDHFNELFIPGKSYETLESLRNDVTEYSKKYNVVMSIKNSNYRSIHLWCKHAGEYRRGKKKVVDEETGNEVQTIRSRQKRTQRLGCLCFIKARYLRGVWVIDKSFGEHNHPVPTNRNEYSINRKQSKETKALIKQLLGAGHKVTDVLSHLSSIGITNIIKKDIENMQQELRRKRRRQAEESTIVALPIIIQTPTPTPIPEQQQVETIEPQVLTTVQIKHILNEQAKNREQTPASSSSSSSPPPPLSSSQDEQQIQEHLINKEEKQQQQQQQEPMIIDLEEEEEGDPRITKREPEEKKMANLKTTQALEAMEEEEV